VRCGRQAALRVLSLHSIPTAALLSYAMHGSVRRPQAEKCAVWGRACRGEAGDFAAKRILDQPAHSLAPRFYTAFRVRATLFPPRVFVLFARCDHNEQGHREGLRSSWKR
jgi:hypothetical protein